MILPVDIISNFVLKILTPLILKPLAIIGGKIIIRIIFKWQFKKATVALDNGKDAMGLFILENLSEQGHPESQYRLGKLYYDGNYDFNQNFKKAWLLFRKAANQEMEQAQFYIGELYYSGKGILKNRYKATEYWEQAAIIKNYPPAQFMLGYLHFKKKEHEKAKEYWQEVTKENSQRFWFYNSLANFMLGSLYLKEEKYVETRQYWKKSANNGLELAQRNLGLSYSESMPGFMKNNIQAYIWLSIASENGYLVAEEHLNEIKLPDDKIMEIQDKVDEMIKENPNLIRPQSDFLINLLD